MSGLCELLLAHVARMPTDIDVVHVGTVLLQMCGTFELLLTHTHVAKVLPDIDVVHIGAVPL